MRFGIDIAQHRMEWDELVSYVRLVEELGFEGFWGFDHFQPMYGQDPGNCFEGMTPGGARHGDDADSTGASRHWDHLPASVAARRRGRDDRPATHGRLDLGLGAAWFEPEHRSLGFVFPPTAERFVLLEEGLEVLTRLMTGELVSFDGRFVKLDQAQYRPLPVQRPHPPIWIGGTGPRRTLPLVARWADAWHAFGTPSEIAGLSGRIDQLATEAGRDPAAILRATSLSLSGHGTRFAATPKRWATSASTTSSVRGRPRAPTASPNSSTGDARPHRLNHQSAGLARPASRDCRDSEVSHAVRRRSLGRVHERATSPKHRRNTVVSPSGQDRMWALRSHEPAQGV